MTKKNLNKGIAIWNKKKTKYCSVTKVQRLESRIRIELAQFKKGDLIKLPYRRFPPEKLIINELQELKEDGILEYILTTDSIKVKILEKLRKTRKFSKELNYIRGMIYRGNHYYIMADPNGKRYRIPSKKMLGYQLKSIFFIQGIAIGRKVINIQKIKIIKNEK